MKDNGRQEGTLSTSLRARLKVFQGQFLKLEASPENVGMKNSASPLAEPVVDCRRLEPGASIIAHHHIATAARAMAAALPAPGFRALLSRASLNPRAVSLACAAAGAAHRSL